MVFFFIEKKIKTIRTNCLEIKKVVKTVAPAVAVHQPAVIAHAAPVVHHQPAYYHH